LILQICANQISTRKKFSKKNGWLAALVKAHKLCCGELIFLNLQQEIIFSHAR
jgi:hypothetical protein